MFAVDYFIRVLWFNFKDDIDNPYHVRPVGIKIRVSNFRGLRSSTAHQLHT